MGFGCGHDLPPAHARLDPDGTCLGVDPDPVHPPRRDQHPALGATRQPVPGGVDTDRQVLDGRVPYGGDHVVGRASAVDHGGALGEPGLETGEFLLVAGVGGAEGERLCVVHEVMLTALPDMCRQAFRCG